MKKTGKTIIGLIAASAFSLIAVLAAFPEKTLASGGIYGSTTYLSLTVGESGGFSVIADNAAGGVSVSTDGSVSASIGTDWIENGAEWVSVYAQGEGTGNVYVTYNGATFDEEPLSGTIVVNVSVSSPQPSGGGESGGGNAGGGNAGGGDWNVVPTKEGSSNVQLSEIKVEGFELKSEINGQYSLTVPFSTKTINIIATAEDSKAKVEGAGKQNLEVGENSFVIIVTAENGVQQPYRITVTRRDEKIGLDDLEDELKNTKEDKVIISLKDGDKLTSKQIELLKKYEKNIELNKYDENGDILYGWSFKGKNISALNEFDPTVTFDSEQKEQLNELANYASGLCLNFAYSGDLPEDTSFRVKADTLGDDGVILRLYYFDKEQGALSLESDTVELKNGYASLSIKHCSEYFLTRAEINGIVKKTVDIKSIICYAVIGAETAAIIVLLILFLNRNKTIRQLRENEKKDINNLDLRLNNHSIH